MELIAHLILQAGCHYSISNLQSLSYQLHYGTACSQHQFLCPAAASWAREGAAAFLAASHCSGSLSLAGNSNSYGSDWSSSWEVLDEAWSLPSQGWITTSCLPWQDSLSGDPPLLWCFSIQFTNRNSWRHTLLAFKGGYSTGAIAVVLAAVPSTWQQCYYGWSHDSIHWQVNSHYKDAKQAN